MRSTEFSFSGIFDGFGRRNLAIEGLLDPDWGQIFSRRSRSAFIETLQLAVLGTVTGGFASLPLALWSTDFGNPNRVLRTIVRTFNNVIRSIPDLLWALLFVTAVGIGALPGLLALFFFSLAVTTKLTADTLDSIDRGPIEAALAGGAGLTQDAAHRCRPPDPSGLLVVHPLQLRAQPAGVGGPRPGRRRRHRRADGSSSRVRATTTSSGDSS